MSHPLPSLPPSQEYGKPAVRVPYPTLLSPPFEAKAARTRRNTPAFMTRTAPFTSAVPLFALLALVAVSCGNAHSFDPRPSVSQRDAAKRIPIPPPRPDLSSLEFAPDDACRTVHSNPVVLVFLRAGSQQRRAARKGGHCPPPRLLPQLLALPPVSAFAS
jgi:hypothetical protein